MNKGERAPELQIDDGCSLRIRSVGAVLVEHMKRQEVPTVFTEVREAEVVDT